jgi:outer membrane protein insertion porin family
MMQTQMKKVLRGLAARLVFGVCLFSIQAASVLAQFGGAPVPPPSNPGFYPPAPIQAPAQPPLIPGPMNQPMPPLNQPWVIDPSLGVTGAPPFGYDPSVRNTPIDVYVTEGQTGRVSFGGSVNSDLGVAGQLIIEERNFDLFRLPGRPSDLFNGAFRGARTCSRQSGAALHDELD